MAYTLSTIAGQVRNRIHDTSFDPSQTTDYINDTINDIFNEYRLPFMEATQAYITTANVADITNGSGLPTNYAQAIDLRNTTSNVVIPFIDIRDLDDVGTGSTGTVEAWTLYGLTPMLYPTPTSSQNVTLRYYKKPTVLTADSDVPEVPSQFQELLVLGAAYRILQVKDNYDQAGILQNKYDEILQKLVDQSAVKQVGSSSTQRINRLSVGKRNF